MLAQRPRVRDAQICGSGTAGASLAHSVTWVAANGQISMTVNRRPRTPLAQGTASTDCLLRGDPHHIDSGAIETPLPRQVRFISVRSADPE
jgi:hypothetical protein